MPKNSLYTYVRIHGVGFSTRSSMVIAPLSRRKQAMGAMKEDAGRNRLTPDSGQTHGSAPTTLIPDQKHA
ncbi:MAG TPA: hypothetical protein V6D12_01440 [Candidatus Obscuribacterales bacterium]